MLEKVLLRWASMQLCCHISFNGDGDWEIQGALQLNEEGRRHAGFHV
jgi:hypothetical protein